MKIAFSSTGDGWKENIDIRFGRSLGFFVFDTETNKTSFINNAKHNSEHGAGTNAAKKIIDENISIIITGQIGPRAREILNSKGIKIYTGIGYGTLEEAYEKYNAGLLALNT
jgi:predicted Fe-Mo cluster-binding NifX family protein